MAHGHAVEPLQPVLALGDVRRQVRGRGSREHPRRAHRHPLQARIRLGDARPATLLRAAGLGAETRAAPHPLFRVGARYDASDRDRSKCRAQRLRAIAQTGRRAAREWLLGGGISRRYPCASRCETAVQAGRCPPRGPHRPSRCSRRARRRGLLAEKQLLQVPRHYPRGHRRANRDRRAERGGDQPDRRAVDSRHPRSHPRRRFDRIRGGD